MPTIQSLYHFYEKLKTMKLFLKYKFLLATFQKIYKCFIKYEPNFNSIARIVGCVCECANGLRTIGICSYLAGVINLFSHARYLNRIQRPAELLSAIIESETTIPVINKDSEENWVSVIQYYILCKDISYPIFSVFAAFFGSYYPCTFL